MQKQSKIHWLKREHSDRSQHVNSNFFCLFGEQTVAAAAAAQAEAIMNVIVH